MTEKVVLLLTGGLIGVMSSLVTAIVNFFLQGIRQKKEWERQDRMNEVQQKKAELESVRDLVAQDQLRELTGESKITRLKPTTWFGCLAVGTQVSMADRSLRSVENISSGDSVLKYSERSRAFGPGVVKTVGSATARRYVSVNKVLKISESQLLQTTDGPVRALDLKIGSYLIRDDGRAQEVCTIQLFNDSVKIVAVSLADEGIFIAEGYCVADYTSKHALTPEEEVAYGYGHDDGSPKVHILPSGEIEEG